MKAVANLVVAFCCLCNWIVSAYQPLVSLFSLKKQTAASRNNLLKTFSGLLGSGHQSSSLPSKDSGDLKMLTPSQSEAHRKALPAWWPFVRSNSRGSLHAGTAISMRENREEFPTPSPPRLRRSESNADSSVILSSLVMQSIEMGKSQQTSADVFAFTDVAGFMDYDPATAARNTHQRRGSSHRRSVEWFRM